MAKSSLDYALLNKQASAKSSFMPNEHWLDKTWVVASLPWVAGAGMAVGHVLTSNNCSIPKQGSCSACGSCVVALGSLTAWALHRQRQKNAVPFYEQK